VIGTLIYYAQAVDPTILTALSTIALQQTTPTLTTIERVRQLVDYVTSQEEATLTYQASNMILAIYWDTSMNPRHKAELVVIFTSCQMNNYLPIMEPFSTLSK
jgi:hypothetical protein